MHKSHNHKGEYVKFVWNTTAGSLEEAFFFFFFFSKFIYFNWRLITLQYYSGFCHTLTWISHGCTSHRIPWGHPSAPALSTLSHALNLDWRSVSHMITYMFQCYSLKSSHPCLLPRSPKDCSIHLCLFCCLACGVIITTFLKFHIYALVYCIRVTINFKLTTQLGFMC